MKKLTEKRTVLMVEDDPFIAMGLEDTFKVHGYDVLGPFADVDSRLKSSRSNDPDVAMLDYSLGRETSITLAQTLYEKDVPYILSSGQVERVITGHDLPERRVVSKSFVPEQLVEIVNNLIYFWNQVSARLVVSLY